MASGHFDQEGTMDQWTSGPAEPIVLSLEQSVPGGNEGGWVEGTDEDEQQKVEAHHDGEVMSRQPRRAAGMSEEEEQRLNITDNQSINHHLTTTTIFSLKLSKIS